MSSLIKFHKLDVAVVTFQKNNLANNNFDKHSQMLDAVLLSLFLFVVLRCCVFSIVLKLLCSMIAIEDESVAP